MVVISAMPHHMKTCRTRFFSRNSISRRDLPARMNPFVSVPILKYVTTIATRTFGSGCQVSRFCPFVFAFSNTPGGGDGILFPCRFPLEATILPALSNMTANGAKLFEISILVTPASNAEGSAPSDRRPARSSEICICGSLALDL